MRRKYVIVGGGLAGASAIEGIRDHDPEGSILLLSRENHLPYNRPPLSKDLWFGKTTKDQISVHADEFYREKGVEVSLRRDVVELDPDARTVWDDRDISYEYEKLLLATGGKPRLIDAKVDEEGDVHYFRNLEDYLLLEDDLERLQHVLVVGGGFIGLELAAAIRHVGKEVTYFYREEYPLRRVLPRDLGLFIAEYYREQGIETVSGDSIVEFSEAQGLTHARTQLGNIITTQLAVVGVGIQPQTDLAEAAGLEVGDGIEVDEHARTSDPFIYAAGDVATYPDLALERRVRIEHWDHAKHHGYTAGANMAGAAKIYDHVPMFYSDFFDIGWEAVGDLDAGLEVHAVWKQPNREGVLFYLRDDVVRGVLLWNSWGKVEWARGLIRQARTMSAGGREAAIPPDA